MNHAVKESIWNNWLCVEVEPQPDTVEKESGGQFVFGYQSMNFDRLDYARGYGPIAIGDTVYQGEEWEFGGDIWTGEKIARIKNNKIRKVGTNWELFAPETMPIQMAKKTFKVIGIEVELMPRHRASPDKPLADCDYRDLDEVWFWNYKLEEINGHT